MGIPRFPDHKKENDREASKPMWEGKRWDKEIMREHGSDL